MIKCINSEVHLRQYEIALIVIFNGWQCPMFDSAL